MFVCCCLYCYAIWVGLPLFCCIANHDGFGKFGNFAPPQVSQEGINVPCIEVKPTSVKQRPNVGNIPSDIISLGQRECRNNGKEGNAQGGREFHCRTM
ncbi:hypothetical protein B0H34DRAFT_706189 [Crassisporium funariophilum]|nr:hypothetical protein B0H34DRAFT_706189 [Crassisporium funariophilum]